MKFTHAVALAISLIAAPVFGVTVPLTYDTSYDAASNSLSGTVCSTGVNGLIAKYPTFGKIPNYPNIGGSFAVGGYNSTECGSCWNLTYTRDGHSNSTYITAVNYAPSGFTISLEAETALTGYSRNQIPANVTVDAKEVARSFCGL